MSQQRPVIVIITQVYPPDPAAVGQQIADAAAELVRRGAEVVVLTARRGYDDPDVAYKRREVLDGVDVRRLPLSSLGKHSIATRLIGGLLFLMQAVARTLFMRRLGVIITSTSPPMAPAAGVLLSRLRRVPLKWWVMDLNPDQLHALGIASQGDGVTRAFDAINQLALRQASDVIVLDRFMAERLRRKGPMAGRLHIIPPWAHEHHIEAVERSANPFLLRNGLTDKFVVMYSGNHSTSHPLITLLEAAVRLRHRDDIRFVFVGGGNGKAEVERMAGSNVLSLPYEPLWELRNSLSAAHVHVVSIGDGMVGIVHPCKIYGAMAAARPVLVLGTGASHAGELLEREPFGWCVQHGDVNGMVRLIERLAAIPPEELDEHGAKGRMLLDRDLAMTELLGRCCTILHGAGSTTELNARPLLPFSRRMRSS